MDNILAHKVYQEIVNRFKKYAKNNELFIGDRTIASIAKWLKITDNEVISSIKTLKKYGFLQNKKNNNEVLDVYTLTEKAAKVMRFEATNEFDVVKESYKKLQEKDTLENLFEDWFKNEEKLANDLGVEHKTLIKAYYTYLKNNKYNNE